jgi:hypothetical protein
MRSYLRELLSGQIAREFLVPKRTLNILERLNIPYHAA